MATVRVIHHLEDGVWWAESPDIPQWTGGGDSYDESHRLAEEGVRFALERDDVTIEHFVPAGSLPAAA